MKSPASVKFKLLGSYFTEKLVFENGKFRALPFNEVISLMCKYSNELQEAKNGRSFSRTSRHVEMPGVEPGSKQAT